MDVCVGVVVSEDLPLIRGVEDYTVAGTREGGNVGGELAVVVAGVGGVEVEVAEGRKSSSEVGSKDQEAGSEKQEARHGTQEGDF